MDEDCLGLAHLLASVRSDVVYPGSPERIIHKRRVPACTVQRSTQDPNWIPKVAANGWTILTRDKQILEKQMEIRAVRDSQARLCAIASHETLRVWDQLRIVLHHWDRILEFHAGPGPAVAIMSRSRFDQVI